MDFKISENFFSIFPNAKIGIVVARNVTNHKGNEEPYKALLDEAIVKAKKYIEADEWTANPVVANWRKAYQQFKTKKGARSSIEALLKRVQTGKGVGTISPLVDIYNSVSLEFGVPCGGEDLEKVKGDMWLTLANGNEEFVTYGSDKSEPPYKGEVIYKDALGAICRCWNWRESIRTMLTEETKQAIFVIESVEGTESNFELALNALKQRIETYSRRTCDISILDREHSTADISF